MRPCVCFIILAIVASASSQTELPECSEDFITYSYTECDKDNGRWRVAVPRNNDCKITKPPAPIRGKDCDFSCQKGEYLDLSNQECRRCPQGTYSLGSGIRFNIWNEVPEGFMLTASSISFAEYGYHSRVGNCSGSLWKPQKEYISSNEDDCTSSLSYSVNVRKKGTVVFKYQYADEDIIFHFYIQNSECQTLHGKGRNVFMNTTGTSWATYRANLDVGTNVIYWKTTGILLSNKDKVSPVLIKDIEISGVSYTTHCHKCLEGYYSDTEASEWCKPCPKDTFSNLGAKECTSCDPKTEYAPPTSSECIKRPPCTEKDYFETHSPCDQNKTTKAMYKWIEPSVCNKELTDSVSLPVSGVVKECSPCNPGFHPTESGKCLPCSKGMFSDGKKECEKCPASTAPVYEYNFIWWDELPSIMNISCLTVHSDECVGKNGWHTSGNLVESSQGQVANAYLVLILHLNGFRSPTVLPDGIKEYGQITFAFELSCKGSCVLYFMKDVHNKGTSVIDSWHGNRLKKTYTYTARENMTATFTWAFQKTSSTSEKVLELVKNDKAKIHFIKVTNAVHSPATGCRSCAAGVDKNGCVPCPAGHYVDVSNKKCKPCADGTYINSENINKNECQACDNGTTSNSKHTACMNDCIFISPITGRRHDFSALSKGHEASTPPSFTNSGRKYIHHYNFSLCGNEGFGVAECINNVSLASNFMNVEPSKKVKSMVCRSTKLSNVGAGGEEIIVFSQPQVIATSLMKVYQADINDTSEENTVFPPRKDQENGDIVYVFRSADVLSSDCKDGVTTHIHLRCDSTIEEGEVKTEMPAACPDGTCDGCVYHFLWRSLEACPECTTDDYNSIESGCNGGYVTTKYIWKSYPKPCRGGVKLPDYSKVACTDLKLYIEIGVLAGTALLFVLCVVLCCLWKKSKKLEYKYQKLVMTSGKNGGELPAADSCALSDSEDDGVDQSDEVVFQKKRSRILGKNKTNNYESVSLKPMQHNVV